MKFLFDLFPVILFFVAYKFADIFVATGVAIAAMVAQIGYVLARGRKVTNMQWASLVIIGLFGGATIALHDETFIKWKPTVLYWLGGVSFLVALAFGKNLVKGVMSEGLELPEAAWFKLCVAWGLFFIFQGSLNLYVAYTYSTDFWVNFKLFGGMGLMILFVIAQALWLVRYVPDESAAKQKPEA